MIGKITSFIVIVLLLVKFSQDVSCKSRSKSGSGSSSGSWEQGEVPFLDVDLTREVERSGIDVVDATLDTIDLTCVFDDDKLLLRRIAAVLTDYGLDESTYIGGSSGGIWQVSETVFDQTLSSSKLDTYRTAIMDNLGIDWSTATFDDLNKPLFSALAARLYLQNLNAGSPRNLTEQARLVTSDFSTNLTETEFSETVESLPNTVCDSARMDVVLILDGSGSVGASDFDKVRDFTTTFIDNIDLGEEKTRVGVIQFSDRIQAGFYLNRYYNKEEAKRAVRNIKYLKGSTDTAKALKFTSGTMFSGGRGARVEEYGIPKVAIVLTDGNSDNADETAQAATSLQNDGVAVFAIGVGGNIDTTELYAIATDPDCSHAFTLTSFSEVVSFVEQIKRLACKEPAQYTLGDRISETLQAAQTMYLTFPVEVEKGLSIDVSTIFGEVEIYLSTKTKNPNSASYQWRCRAHMESRGTCKIPPGHLKNLFGNRKTASVFASLEAPLEESVRFVVICSGAIESARVAGTVIMVVLILQRFLL